MKKQFSIAMSCIVLALAMFATMAVAAERRVAVVIGVSAYQHVPTLPNTGNDARAIGAAFERLGFEVDLVIDPDRAAMEAAVRRFGARATGADAAVFYYAGHALELGGRNWLVPTGAQPHTERDMRFEALDLDTVLEQAEGAARVTMIFLDSCRDNPFKLQLGAETTRGLAARGIGEVTASVGTLVVFSTAPGSVAEDGAGPNSPFTEAMLKHIEEPGLEVRQLVAEVRRDVREATGGRQVPWENSSLEGQFFFRVATGPAPAASAGSPPGAGAETLFWESIRASGDPMDYRAYLERFPEGIFARLARNRLDQLSIMYQSAAMRSPVAAAVSLAATAVPLVPSAPLEASSSNVRSAAATVPVAQGPLNAALLDALATSLAKHAAWLSDTDRVARVRQYADQARGHRAILLPMTRHDMWLSGGWRSVANVEEVGLEKCQLAFGEPCSVLAVDDMIMPASDRPRVHDMPRLSYAGPFDPAEIPAVQMPARRRPEIVGYAAAAGHKAMALHPFGRIFTSSEAASERDAQTTALAACNKAFAHNPRLGPCYLYAVGTKVVLPLRLTKAQP